MDASIEAAIERGITRLAESLTSGLDVADVALVVRGGVELADALPCLSGGEKREVAIAFAESMVDEFLREPMPGLERIVEQVNLPGPELIERHLWEPAILAHAPALLRPIIKAAIPSLVDLVVDATRGRVAVNNEEGKT